MKLFFRYLILAGLLGGPHAFSATFTVTNTNDSGAGSLRQAILQANTNAGPDTIAFNLPPGSFTITPAGPLPPITNVLVLDGFTQSGSSSNTLANGNNANQLIRLQGSPASGTGLTLEGPSNVVRGIIFTGFQPQGVEVVSSDNVIEGCLFGITPAGVTNGNDWGVVVRGSRNRIGGPLPEQRVVLSGNSAAMQLNFDSFSNVVQGCFVGTDIGGIGMRANGFDGIAVGGTNNVIGGPSLSARNVVCGFGNSGINVGGFGHTVQGNLVGTDVMGTNVLGNFNIGITLPFGAASNLIGGSVAGAGNLILGVSSPAGPCINVTGGGNVIQGNFIGTDASGTIAAGKTHGILVGFNPGNVIGGTNAGEGNVIAFNFEGVHINGTSNPIRGNSIHSNTGRGIALGNLINVNDPGDGDSGANEQQNYPTITNATGTLAGTTIQGFLSSKASTLYQLDFFSSVVRDAVNRGEGQKYLGSGTVMTDGSGNGNFSVVVGVLFGRQISATATDPAGNTSEFSDCFAATSTVPPSTNVVANTNNSGPGSLRQALLNAGTNASATPNVIAFAIPGTGPHVIRQLSALPPPIEWVAIEGFSQPGASANTSTNGDNAVRKIILHGSMAGAAVNGLTFEGRSNIVRGLVIQSFYGNGIAFTSNSIGNVVEGSFLTGNTNSGVLVNCANNLIGGTTAAARNLLSGNGQWGVTLQGNGARSNVIAGNLIGPDSTGASPLPNRRGGVLISDASTNTIGGSMAGRNIISGNTSLDFFSTGPGIEITGAGSSNNLVQGNFIGATPFGGPLSNKAAGILISSSAMRTLIGAPQPPAAAADLENLIAFNGSQGVDVQSGDGHIIRANRIFENNGLGINLGFGANPQQVAPVITNATITASNVAIRGRLSSKANATYGLDFYSTVIPDSSGIGEAHKYLGSTNVTTDGSGNVAFNVAFAVMPTGEFITATATDETSAFAITFRATVDGSLVPQTFVVTSSAPGGPGSLAEAVNQANAHPGSDTILFAVPVAEVSAGLKIVSPVVLNGDVSGQKVLVDARGIPDFQAVFELTAHGNTFSNLAVVGAPGDAFLVKSSTNLFTALEVGRQQPAQGIGGDAFEFAGGTTGNLVENTEISNVRGNAFRVSSGAKFEMRAGVSFQSVVGALVSKITGPAAPTVVSQTPDTNFTTVTFGVTGTNGQTGTLRVYLLDPDEHALATPLASTNYTIVSGGALQIAITIPFQATPKFVVAFDVRPGSDKDTSPPTPKEPTIFQGPIVLRVATAANYRWSISTIEPVNLFTGEYFDLLAPDLDLGGPLPLLFQRYYASFLLRDGKAIGRLGNNWRHNFEWSLTNKNTTIEIVSPMGRVITFTNDSFNFALLGRQDIPYQLIYFFGSGDFMLADPISQMTYRFDASGKLIFITDGRGNSHHLAYGGTQLTNVTDGLGRALTFQYSGSGFLTNVSDGTRSVEFTQSNTNLTVSRDALGKLWTNVYTSTVQLPGLLTQRWRPLGNTRFTQVYDSAGRVSQQYQLQANDQTIFTYGFNMAIERDPFNFEREYYHNANGEFTGFADEANVASTMTYNTNGQRASITDRRGLTTRIAYHVPSGRIAAITNADGSVIVFTYTNRSFGGITFHDLSKVIFPDGTSESYTYDGNGNVTSLTDQAARVSRFSWNARGQLLTATNPTGGVVTFSYNFDGTTATAADSETGATSFFYDSLRRLTNLVHPDGTSRRWQFDANDRLLSMTDERTNTVTFTYDANDRLLRIVDANGDTAGFAYDNADRIVTVTNSAGDTATITYDDRGHVSVATDFNGNPTAFGVDSRHRLTSLARNVQSWQFGYNNEAQVTSITNSLAQASLFWRDVLGFLTGVTNPLGHATSFALDVMRRLTNSVDPLQRSARFAYDARGLLASATAPVVGTASFERNDLGLLSKIAGLNGEQWNFGYSPLGRLQFVADPLNRTNRVGYDNRGRQNSATFADGTTLSNTLDGAGLLLRRQFSAGPDITYAYDKVNRLTNATGSDPVLFSYDANGRLTNTVSSGVNFGAAYDSASRLTSVSYSNGAFTVTYTYNGNDQLIRVTDSLTGTLINYFYDNAGRHTVTTRPNGVNGSYTYDAAGRLTRIQEGSIIDIPFTLDAAGQIVQAGFIAPLDPEALITNSQATPLTYDAAHQINSAGYGYDARGRLTASPGKTFTWDSASRLTGIGAVALGYDGLNQIAIRTEGGVTTRYFYNHAIALAPIMAERNETTMQVQRYYVWSPGGRLLYLIDAANGNAVRHVHTDQVGSVLALTSAAGAVTDAYAYTPYGELLGRTGTSAQPFTYVGAYGVRSEPAANLYHMRARYYDPLSARFLSRDPIWPTLDGLDPYEYAVANPLTYIDPLGLQAGSTTTRFFNRRSTVSLFSDAGNLRLGRDYTPTFWNLTIFDAFGTSGLGSSLDVRHLRPRTTDHIRQDNSIGYFLGGPIAPAYQLAAEHVEETVGRKPNSPSPAVGANPVADGDSYPRFAQADVGPSTVANIVSASTTLLVPYAVAEGAYDTGIALANTTADPFGGSPQSVVAQSGIVQLTFYKASSNGPGIGLASDGSGLGGSSYSVLISELMQAASAKPVFGTHFNFQSIFPRMALPPPTGTITTERLGF